VLDEDLPIRGRLIVAAQSSCRGAQITDALT
jgi:hypothetical protein